MRGGQADQLLVLYHFAEDECDNSTTAASTANYGEYEDCSISFAQPIDVFVPLFSTEPYVTKYYDATCNGHKWVDNYVPRRVCDRVHNCDPDIVTEHAEVPAVAEIPQQGPCWTNRGPWGGNWCVPKVDGKDKVDAWTETEKGQCRWEDGNCRMEDRLECRNCRSEYYEFPCQHSFLGGDVVTVDAMGANKARDTHQYNGELADSGMNGVKATHMIFQSDRDTGHPGFKICAVNPFKNVKGHAPRGGSSPEGTVPPDNQACPCGTDPTGPNPQGPHENPVSEGSGDNCYSNPAWPCDRDAAADRRHYASEADRDTSVPLSKKADVSAYMADTAEASTLRERFMVENGCSARTVAPHMNSSSQEMFCDMLKTKHEDPGQIKRVKSRPTDFVDADDSSGSKWQNDVRQSLSRNRVKASVACCVCQGGWVAGYDPQGDMATETELGEMTRPECVLAAKATAGANAASIDDTATETVTGTCYAETNAHYSPAGWTSGAPRQACLFEAAPTK